MNSSAYSHRLRLQWGRRLSTTETSACGCRLWFAQGRFNGAVVFQRRKRRDSHGTEFQAYCFNGAVVFQRRKRGPCLRWKAEEMRLQWGRRLSTTETSIFHPRSFAPRRLQWGRRLSTTETRSWPADRHLMGGLQWGRRLSTTETC